MIRKPENDGKACYPQEYERVVEERDDPGCWKAGESGRHEQLGSIGDKSLDDT